MKSVKIIFLFLSVLLVFILIFYIIDTQVSLKYEIYEYRILFDDKFVPTERAEDYLLRVVRVLKFFLYYVLATILLIIISFFLKMKE